MPGVSRPRDSSSRSTITPVASRLAPASVDERRDAAIEREPPRHGLVRADRVDRHARAERGQHARRLAFTRDRDDGRGVARFRERHGRFAQRAVVLDVDDVRRPARSSSDGVIDSASRITASSVCTVFTGKSPTAVSPDSMIASTASSTALAASLTSARVGRGSLRHRVEHLRRDDHRLAAARAPTRDFLLHARHALERHLEAEVAARDHHAVAVVEDGVEVGHGRADARSSRSPARPRGRATRSARARGSRRPPSARS